MPQSTLRDTLPSDMSRDIVHHASHRGRSNTQIARTDNNCTQGAQDSSSCLVPCASIPLSTVAPARRAVHRQHQRVRSVSSDGLTSAPVMLHRWMMQWRRKSRQRHDTTNVMLLRCACDRCERSAQGSSPPARPRGRWTRLCSPNRLERSIERLPPPSLRLEGHSGHARGRRSIHCQKGSET